MKHTLGAVAVTLACAAAVPAQVVYFGYDNPRGTLVNSTFARASFLAHLSRYGTDNIEAYAAFAPDPTLRFGPIGLTATTDVDFVASFASLAVSGSKSLLDRADGGDTFTFNAPVTAFGTHVTQAGDGQNINTITFRLENTALGTTKDVAAGTFGPNATFDSVFFFGVTDTAPFNRVTVLESIDANDGTLYDNVTAGYVGGPAVFSLPGGPPVGPVTLGAFARGIHVVPVPEPGSAMLVAAVAGSVWRACRRRVRPETGQTSW